MSIDDALSLTPYQIAALSQKKSSTPHEMSYGSYLADVQADTGEELTMAQKAALAAKRDQRG